MFLQVIQLMPTICTCKETSCKVIMIEHYPCSVTCQFFLFPVLRHNILGENLHHPHMPSADVYSNKSSMWFFFSHHRVLQRTTPKATLHLFTHACTWCSFLELYPLAACSMVEASWNGYSAVCPAHPLCSPSILCKLSSKSNLLKHLLQPVFLYVIGIT